MSRVTLLLLAVVGTSCAFLQPKTNALKEVHATYRAEFAEFVLPPPSTQTPTAPAAPSDQPAFAETLDAIRGFRMKYPDDSREAAHLTVLEGMIYLQIGRFGMARLLMPDVATAGARLHTGDGRFTRDGLLAASFDHLVTGWQEIHEKNDDDDATIGEFQKLEAAADGIGAALDRVDASRLREPDADAGAVYLATTAAIFYVWVFTLREEADALDGSGRVFFEQGRDLIGRFLSETERRAAVSVTSGAHPAGRLRYLDWFGFLSQEARMRT